ncbi:LysR substrate-binding domain-containing protein [Conexibacter arvalis]|uniref:DNA-binding transcriptional LysR family regulator n=1 Tax=Conexibacter arvalis TaxID=912552 RepID=A0A840IMA7_9ACTN|nr:DNA-binding transcriptional LysR family regulator [Conexibacter arvalis]
MDLDAVRTAVAVAETGQFQKAALKLSITQQAVSKRIASLERDLGGVRLFTRTARAVELTIDGQAFMPHARHLLEAEARAAASVRPSSRALRIDVINPRIGPGLLVQDFHRTHPEIDLDIVMLFDAETAIAGVHSGAIDATFRAVSIPLPHGIDASRVLDDPLQLLTGPAHELAAAESVAMADLAGHRIWMPAIVSGTEWAAYYEALAAAFGLTIDPIGPNFGTDVLLEMIADAPALATFVGEQMRLAWPSHYDLRRIPLRDPTPVYPHSLIWRSDNKHPGLAALREHVFAAPSHDIEGDLWMPSWAETVRTGARSGV